MQSITLHKNLESDANLPLFVNKWHFLWSTTISLDNNIDAWIGFYLVFMVYT